MKKRVSTGHLRTPPLAVAKNAEMGLQLRREFGRGGTDVGIRRAQQLSKSAELQAVEIKKIASYFAHHEVDKQAKAHVWGDVSNPSAGFIAWQLWGGDEGPDWAENAVVELGNDP